MNGMKSFDSPLVTFLFLQQGGDPFLSDQYCMKWFRDSAFPAILSDLNLPTNQHNQHSTSTSTTAEDLFYLCQFAQFDYNDNSSGSGTRGSSLAHLIKSKRVCLFCPFLVLSDVIVELLEQVLLPFFNGPSSDATHSSSSTASSSAYELSILYAWDICSVPVEFSRIKRLVIPWPLFFGQSTGGGGRGEGSFVNWLPISPVAFEQPTNSSSTSAAATASSRLATNVSYFSSLLLRGPMFQGNRLHLYGLGSFASQLISGISDKYFYENGKRVLEESTQSSNVSNNATSGGGVENSPGGDGSSSESVAVIFVDRNLDLVPLVGHHDNFLDYLMESLTSVEDEKGCVDSLFKSDFLVNQMRNNENEDSIELYRELYGYMQLDLLPNQLDSIAEMKIGLEADDDPLSYFHLTVKEGLTSVRKKIIDTIQKHNDEINTVKVPKILGKVSLNQLSKLMDWKDSSRDAIFKYWNDCYALGLASINALQFSDQFKYDDFVAMEKVILNALSDPQNIGNSLPSVYEQTLKFISEIAATYKSSTSSSSSSTPQSQIWKSLIKRIIVFLFCLVPREKFYYDLVQRLGLERFLVEQGEGSLFGADVAAEFIGWLAEDGTSCFDDTGNCEKLGPNSFNKVLPLTSQSGVASSGGSSAGFGYVPLISQLIRFISSPKAVESFSQTAESVASYSPFQSSSLEGSKVNSTMTSPNSGNPGATATATTTSGNLPLHNASLADQISYISLDDSNAAASAGKYLLFNKLLQMKKATLRSHKWHPRLQGTHGIYLIMVGGASTASTYSPQSSSLTGRERGKKVQNFTGFEMREVKRVAEEYNLTHLIKIIVPGTWTFSSRE